jgi:hypothetical protein
VSFVGVGVWSPPLSALALAGRVGAVPVAPKAVEGLDFMTLEGLGYVFPENRLVYPGGYSR